MDKLLQPQSRLSRQLASCKQWGDQFSNVEAPQEHTGPAEEVRGNIRRATVNSLVGNKDLERAHNLCERDRLISLPVLGRLDIINEDDEVLVLALEVDLGLLCFSASHDCVVIGVLVWI